MADHDRPVGAALLKAAATSAINTALSNPLMRERLDTLASAWLVASGAAHVDEQGDTEPPAAVLPFPGGAVNVEGFAK